MSVSPGGGGVSEGGVPVNLNANPPNQGEGGKTKREEYAVRTEHCGRGMGRRFLQRGPGRKRASPTTKAGGVTFGLVESVLKKRRPGHASGHAVAFRKHPRGTNEKGGFPGFRYEAGGQFRSMEREASSTGRARFGRGPQRRWKGKALL